MSTTSRVYHAKLYFQTIRQARRFVRKVLREIETEAKIIAAAGPYSTGRLARSIGADGPIVIGTVVKGDVGTRLSYARIVEGGAGIHNIFPKGAPHVYRFGRGTSLTRTYSPTLKFYWRKAGRVVYPYQIPMSPRTVGISHPGQKAKGFLFKPLRNAAIRHRMAIVVFDR